MKTLKNIGVEKVGYLGISVATVWLSLSTNTLATTYDFSRSFDGASVKGTLSTNDKTGILQSTDFTDWNINLTIEDISLTLTPGNSSFQTYENGVTATPNELIFNVFSPEPTQFDPGIVLSATRLIRPDGSETGSFYSFQQSANVASEGVQVISETMPEKGYFVPNPNPPDSFTAPVSVSSVPVPETPSTLSSLLLSLFGVGLVFKRQLRQQKLTHEKE